MEENGRGRTWTISNRQEEDNFRTPLAITDELKFVEYAHSLPDQRGRVFPELKRQGTKSKREGGKDRMRYGHYPSTNWFPNYKRKECGIVAAKPGKSLGRIWGFGFLKRSGDRTGKSI